MDLRLTDDSAGLELSPFRSPCDLNLTPSGLLSLRLGSDMHLVRSVVASVTRPI